MSLQSFGTNDCVEDIVNKYSKTVYKLAFARTRNKDDAEDIFQDVFLIYIRKRPAFASEEHEKAWFIRVTINCSKTFWSSLKKKSLEILDEDIPSGETPEEIMEEYLEKLPIDYRTVIHLFYYENMSTTEISNILDKKESTVRMQLTRARRLLKDFMKGANVHV